MTYLVAGIGVVLLIWALIWIGLNAPASRVVKWLKWAIIGGFVVAIIVLLAMGYFRPAMMSGMFLLPLLFPWRRLRAAAEQAQYQGQSRGAVSNSGMTIVEAADILGVAPDAGVEEIKDAHRKLMAENHPDKGGSPWFARQINQARDTLLSD